MITRNRRVDTRGNDRLPVPRSRYLHESLVISSGVSIFSSGPSDTLGMFGVWLGFWYLRVRVEEQFFFIYPRADPPLYVAEEGYGR